MEDQPVFKTFPQTQLFKALQSRAQNSGRAKNIVSAIEQILNLAEEILRAAGTSPLDFTLHDNQHAFRVAEKMILVLAPGMLDVLSSEEVGLLLLSAYLHDIGMMPAKERLVDLRNFLVVGENAAKLIEPDRKAFYDWFDSSQFADVVSLPIQLSTPTSFDQLEQVLTYYVRSRHNDWSGEWIKQYVDPETIDKYPEFKDDLIRLCKSHHYGYEELIKEDYNAKQIGITDKPTIVNLRFLCCILRLADILDFDPDRTPDIIYQYRGIAKKSRVFWYQNFHINSTLTTDRKKFIFEAHPPNATLHQALRVVASDITHELQLCRRMDTTHPFRQSIIGDIPHVWDLPAELTVIIKPKDHAYEFIEGAFRPNTSRLLTLLSGTQLYRSELDGIRELLQNAFDAVKESMAYEVTSGHVCVTGKELVTDALSVEIRMEESEGRTFIVCADQGVGMTKQIIENYLLVSGNSRSGSLRSLERQLLKSGIRLGRTGTFGIGVLSYFMLADEVTITTRRSQLCHDDEGTGWWFQTNGIGGFGELRRQTHRLRGTEVRLRLKDTTQPIHDIEKQVFQYLKRLIIRIPCTLRFVGTSKAETWKSGWITKPSDFEEGIVSSIKLISENAVTEELLTADEKIRRHKEAQFAAELQIEIRSRLRWFTLDGTLDDEIGFFRAHLPYFDLPGGACLAFFHISEGPDGLAVQKFGLGHYMQPSPVSTQAWEGMFYGHGGLSEQAMFFVEIDWTSVEAGEISVDRWSMRRNTNSQNALNKLEKFLKQEIHKFISKHSESVYYTLNCKLANLKSVTGQPHWLVKNSRGEQWSPLKFPCKTWDTTDSTEVNGDHELFQPQRLYKYSGEYHYEWYAWPTINSDPDRVLIMPSVFHFELVPVYDAPAKVLATAVVSSAFPPNWEHCAGVKFSNLYDYNNGAIIWNRNSPLVARFGKESWNAVGRIFPQQNESLNKFNPLAHKDQLINDEGFLASFIGRIMVRNLDSLWIGLLENDKEIRAAVQSWFQQLGIEEHFFALGLEWFAISASGLRPIKEDHENIGQIKKLLPKPPDSWLIKRELREEDGFVNRLLAKSDPWR